MRTLRYFICIVGLAILGAPVSADLGDELHKLLPADGEAHDNFGWDVAADATTLIVGAPGDGDGGQYAGSAYLFDAETGQELAKLQAGDVGGGDVFGYSVALSGDIAVVGAPQNNDLGPNSGAAYVFDLTTGQQLHKLLPADGGAEHRFGWDVALDGSVAVIGAYLDDDNGAESGSAYVFDVTNGQQIHKLVPADGEPNDEFGVAVGISNDTIIVGAWHDDDSGYLAGAAYLFDAATGQQIGKLLADDGGDADTLGRSVAIEDDVAVVGAPGYGNSSGAVHLFDVNTGTQLQKLLPDDYGAQMAFGWSVAIDSGVVVIGAFQDDDLGGQSGSVYLFDAAAGAQITELHASDGAAGDNFGHSAVLSGDILAVGATLDDDNGSNSGSAYLLDASGLAGCAGDLDGDGATGQTDLGILLASYGIDNGGDLDGDGDTDQADLGLLLADYGCTP